MDCRQSWIMDSMLWIPDSSYRITNSLSVDLGFRIPIVSYSLNWFIDSKAQDSGFHEQGFRNLDYLTWGDKVKKTNIEKEVGKKLLFGIMNLEACLLLFDVYLKFWSHREDISVSWQVYFWIGMQLGPSWREDVLEVDIPRRGRHSFPNRKMWSNSLAR